jgi:regulatory protein
LSLRRAGAAPKAAESPSRSCYDRACDLLARRPHFRAELAAKLGRRGYPPAETAAAIDRLAAQGYLDDGAAARGFVASRLARGALGRERLRAELAQRGAPPDAIAAALAELPTDEVPAARAAAARWRGRSPQALARHLAAKGFSRHAIFAVLKDRPAAAGLDPELGEAAFDASAGEPDDGL